MKRITVALSEDLANTVDREANRTGDSVSAIVRRALHALLGGGVEKKKPAFIALGQSGTHDTSRRVDELLHEQSCDAGNR